MLISNFILYNPHADFPGHRTFQRKVEEEEREAEEWKKLLCIVTR
jgi:hypothetical protein